MIEENTQDYKNYKLKINYEKTCKCPSNHISCIDAKSWLKSQVAIQ